MEINKIELLDSIFALPCDIQVEQGEVFPIPLIRQLGSKVTWYVREDPGNPRLRKGGPAKV